MDAVSHLLEDSQLRDEPVSGETDDPLDWRSSFIFTIGKRCMGKVIVFSRYLEHIYTNNQPETKEVLNELTRFEKENGPAEMATNLMIQKPQSWNLSAKMGSGKSFAVGLRDWEFWILP